MKRILALALALSLLLGSVLLPNAYAQANDFSPEELEQLMQTALPLHIERLQLQDYSYQYSGTLIYGDYRHALFYFTHNSDPSSYNVNIALNRRGELLNYDRPSQSFPYSVDLHFPTASRAEIIAIAEAFIARCLPEIADEVGALSSLNIGRNKQATLRYQRQISGVPVADDEMHLQIDLESNRVVHMRRWDSYDLELLAPPSDEDIDLAAPEAAWDAVRDHVGLRLQYAQRYNPNNVDSQPRIVLEYAWAKESFQIDAYDANLVEKRIPEYDAPPPHYVRPPYSSWPAINEAQLRALFPDSTPLSPEKATEMLNSLPGIDMDGFVLNSSSYYHDSHNAQTELWLRFSPPETETEPQAYSWIVAAFSVDDRSLVLLNCQLPPSEQGDSWTDEQLRERGDAFISKAAPERFRNLLWDENYVPYEKTRGVQEYRYLRQVNGLPFISNATALQLNEYTGAIHSYYSFWDSVRDVPSAKPALSSADVYALFKEEMPLQLVYRVEAVPPDSGSEAAPETWQARLVYENPQLAAAVIDAHSGERYDYIASSDSEQNREYSDLTDHPLQEQLQQTAAFLGFPDEELFRPEDIISQGEFLQWLSCLQEYSYPHRSSEDIYREMISQRVVEERQQKPQHRLQQWEGVLYLMRRLGYGRVEKVDADLYRLHASSPRLSGHASAYVALAEKHGWIDSGFQAEAELSRAEALMMIYRYLSR